jgi:hypothetical protein
MLYTVFITRIDGQLDDFHKSTKANAEEEIRTGLREIE